MSTYALMVLENCVTLLVTAAVIIGGLRYGAGGYAWLGLLILLNINYIKKPSPTPTPHSQSSAPVTSDAEPTAPSGLSRVPNPLTSEPL